MSTKIYDAYRVKKSDVDDIFELLYEFKQTAIEYVRTNEKLLKAAHVGAFFYHSREVQDDQKALEKVVKRFNKDGAYIDFEIKQYLEYSENLTTRSYLSCDVQVKICLFSDEDYWYMKFFINDGHMTPLLKVLEEKFSVLEDYHYQNQTDSPKDVPYEEFSKRGSKWDELLERGDSTFRESLQYDAFDAYEFIKLMRRHFFTGEEKLFKHLAYKFPPLDIKKEDEEE